jgi:hypothetical protein
MGPVYLKRVLNSNLGVPSTRLSPFFPPLSPFVLYLGVPLSLRGVLFSLPEKSGPNS